MIIRILGVIAMSSLVVTTGCSGGGSAPGASPVAQEQPSSPDATYRITAQGADIYVRGVLVDKITENADGSMNHEFTTLNNRMVVDRRMVIPKPAKLCKQPPPSLTTRMPQ